MISLVENTKDLVAMAIGSCLLGLALFLANDPHGIHSLQVLQWLMPDLGARYSLGWVAAWSALRGQPPEIHELALTFLAGLLAGSLLNVIISRTPPRAAASARAQSWRELGYDQAADRELAELPPGFATGRSLCIHCGIPIPPVRLIPVISWLRLRGRSACCDRPIPVRYPVVELLTAIVFTLVHWRIGFDPVLYAALIFTAMMIALAVIDLEQLILPDILVLPLLWYGLAANAHGGFAAPGDAILGAVAGYCAFRAFREGWFRITGRTGLGLGDCKLAAAIGAWAGAAGLLQVAILASGAAFTVHGFLAVIGKGSTDRYLALGPWLAGAAVFWLLFPDAIPRIFHVPLYT